MKDRFVPIRNGLSDHLEQGRLGSFDFGIYVRIHLGADFRTGIWRGSAGKLLAQAPADGSLRRIQESLQRLEVEGYIRRFRVPGRRGNCPTLINKYDIRDGALKGMRLNASKTTDWHNPIYEARTDNGTAPHTDDATDERTDPAPIQEERAKRKGRKEGAQAQTLSRFVFEGLWFKVTERQDKTLSEGFPWVDRQAEYRKADSWCEANPSRRPGSSGRFLHNWFSRIPSPGEKGGPSRAETRTARNLAIVARVQADN